MTECLRKSAIASVCVVVLSLPTTTQAQVRYVGDSRTESRVGDSSEVFGETSSPRLLGQDLQPHNSHEPDIARTGYSNDVAEYISSTASTAFTGKPLGWMLPRKASARVTWLAGGGDEGLGSTNINLSTTFMRPSPWLENAFMSVSPSFSIQSLDAPKGVDLPSELYRGSLSFSLMKPINERTQLMLGLSPSFASDLEGGGSEAFRFMAFGTLLWQSSPSTKWTFGVAVTGREDIPVLPMAGLIWTPTEDWQIDVAVPRPKVARRVYWFDSAGNDWLYVAGEFGGGTWAVDRGGQDDVLTLRDFRFVLGWERKSKQGMNPRIETGYVFGREIEYESDDFQFEPSDTVMIRAGLSF